MNNFKEEESLITHLTEYVKKFFLATKQEVKIDSLNLAGTVIASVFLLCVSMLFLVVLSIFLGLLLHWWSGSYLLSFGILSAVYGTIVLIACIYRKKLKTRIIQAIIHEVEQ